MHTEWIAIRLRYGDWDHAVAPAAEGVRLRHADPDGACPRGAGYG
jgi:hypothetical protein